MLKTLLFDLDDTLLGNDIATFLPHYLPRLARYAATLVDGSAAEFIPAVLGATEAMINNLELTRTNAAVFWDEMNRLTGIDWLALDAPAYFDTFYRGPFNELKMVTTLRPVAHPLIEWALASGLEIVIATNPLFPRTAIEARLAWAGLPVSKIPFTLLTTMENMHTAKPHQAYYAEILAMVGRRPQEVMMIGNDWQNDIAPAAALGIPCYWIVPDGISPPDEGLVSGFGDLTRFFNELRDLIHAAHP